MKSAPLIILALLFTLQSCGQKKSASVVSSYKNKVVLGAFNDMIAPSSFNEESLSLLPKVVNFSNKMTAVKNQGHRGTCTFFAATALVEAAIKMDLGIDVNLSEEYLIYSTKNQGYYSDVEASHISVNLQSLKNGGIALEKDWSYFPSFFLPGKPCAGIDGENTQAPMNCYVHTPDQSILDKVIPANAIKTGFIRKNTNEMIKYLAKHERPLTISLPVNYKGWKDWGEVTYTESMRQECLSNPSQCGAHSVVVTGYNLEEQIFYFKNSWGKDWGNNGFGTLSFEMVDRYVDGYLYYAKVEGDLNIPDDANIDNFKIENLVVNPILSESQMTLDLKINATQLSGRYIEVQNHLGYTLGLTPEDKSEIYPLLNSQCSSILAKGNSVYRNSTDQLEALISMPVNTLQETSVQEVLADPISELALANTVFLYTDTSVEPTPIFQNFTHIKK